MTRVRSEYRRFAGICQPISKRLIVGQGNEGLSTQYQVRRRQPGLGNRLGVNGFMARQLSTSSGYASVITQAIESAKDDPVHLRSLIYSLARQSIGRYVLDNYQVLGSEGLQQHLRDLEAAIDKVENVAQQQKQVGKAKQQRPTAADRAPLTGRISSAPSETPQAAQISEALLLVRPESSPPQTALTVRNAFADLPFEDDRPVKTPVVLREVKREPEVRALEILEPSEIWAPGFGHGPRPKPKRTAADVRWTFQLATAALIGVGIYAVMLARSDVFFSASEYSRTASMSSNAVVVASTAPTAVVHGPVAPPSLGFPLPSVYGIYAISAGKLYELDQLAMRVPDPRVRISAMISEPSHVTVPDGNVSFVIYRRDLATSAPMEVFVRVVAQVEQEMKFASGGHPKVTDTNGQWAVLSKSYPYRVAPVDDHPEMIVLHPGDQQPALSPGRYVLVLAGRGYDFTVAGEITDVSQCLERTDVIGGDVYSVCRTLR